MELDFIGNINNYGEHVVRLYNFDKSEAIKFKALIKDTIITKKEKLDLSTVDFIQMRNCNLILGLYKVDEGILSKDYKTFYCLLTMETYENMLLLLEPFCIKETKGYKFLYEIDTPTDFLFSPAGTAP